MEKRKKWNGTHFPAFNGFIIESGTSKTLIYLSFWKVNKNVRACGCVCMRGREREREGERVCGCTKRVCVRVRKDAVPF